MAICMLSKRLESSDNETSYCNARVEWTGFVSRVGSVYNYEIKKANPSAELYPTEELARSRTHRLTDVQVNLHFGPEGEEAAMALSKLMSVRFRGKITGFYGYGGGPTINLADVVLLELPGRK